MSRKPRRRPAKYLRDQAHRTALTGSGQHEAGSQQQGATVDTGLATTTTTQPSRYNNNGQAPHDRDEPSAAYPAQLRANHSAADARPGGGNSASQDGAPAPTPLAATASGLMHAGDHRTGQVADVKLTTRAIKERWPISDDVRRGIVLRLSAIGIDGKLGWQANVQAGRALLAADLINLREQMADAQQPQQHQHAHVHLHAPVSADGQRAAAIAAIAAELEKRTLGGDGIGRLGGPGPSSRLWAEGDDEDDPDNRP